MSEFELPEGARAALAARAEPVPTADEVELREAESLAAARSYDERDGALPVPSAFEKIAGEVRCSVCGSMIDRPLHSYRRVQGWEKPRTQGGTNAIRLRQPLDEYACVTCIEVRQGQPHVQEVLGG